jgi:hypothetical protein
MFAKNGADKVEMLLKTLVFLSLHISQKTSMSSKVIDLLRVPEDHESFDNEEGAPKVKYP